METLVAVDPGKSGCIAVDDGELVCHRMPKGQRELWEIFAGLDPGLVVVENVHSSPQMGVASSFAFGRGFGRLEGVIAASGLSVEYVTPQAWKKELGIKKVGGGFGVNDKEKKAANKALAVKLYPELKVRHWNADALLIMEYCKRRYELFQQCSF